MKCAVHYAIALGLALGSHRALADSTNAPAATNTAAATNAPATPRKLDESAFRIVSERNIFNANRSGGTVRAASSRRPARVESFALVGTMAYERGAFAFFEGSSSEFTKVVKTDGVIAGHKVVDILAHGVKLEMDGQFLEVAIGTGLRREDQGAWKATDSVSTGNGGSRDAGDRDRRDRRGDDANSARDAASQSTATASPAASADQSDVLKRLMERRAKENE